MDAMQHTVWITGWTVSGAYFQSGVGFPLIGQVVKAPLQGVVGGFADMVLGVGAFLAVEKFVPEKAGIEGELKDGVEAFCLGYAASSALSFIGL